MRDYTDRSNVAWDIETTGFGWESEITVCGFWYGGGHATLLVNAGPHTVDEQSLTNRLEDASGADVRVRVCDDETAVLEGMGEELFERFDREYDRLVAYNADSWKGGFDLPFVRTRCIRRGVDWVLEGVTSADLYDPVKKRLNTTHTGYGASADANTLTGAHELLFEDAPDQAGLLDVDGHPWYASRAYDPFEDSGSAAHHYRNGDLLPVCLHNLADIHRTWELSKLVCMFVPSNDVTEKKL
jgi:hypothetical protein